MSPFYPSPRMLDNFTLDNISERFRGNLSEAENPETRAPGLGRNVRGGSRVGGSGPPGRLWSTLVAPPPEGLKGG